MAFFEKSVPLLGVFERLAKAKTVKEERQAGVHCHFAVAIVPLRYYITCICSVWHINSKDDSKFLDSVVVDTGVRMSRGNVLGTILMMMVRVQRVGYLSCQQGVNVSLLMHLIIQVNIQCSYHQVYNRTVSLFIRSSSEVLLHVFDHMDSLFDGNNSGFVQIL